MTSRYRVEYALKSHRRDEFIEWIKGLLAVPFVLHSDVENYDTDFTKHVEDPEAYEDYILSREYEIALESQKRYREIFQDVENLIEHTITIDNLQEKHPDYVGTSRLRKLVPSVGKFFTPLPLTEAFLIEDSRRLISKRRLVSPSFNDVRTILNTAQILSLAKIYKDHSKFGSRLKLVTFDGDVTLYDDGSSLTPESPVIDKLIKLLSMDLFIGVVTAAGYPGQLGAPQYYSRLKGLIDRIRVAPELTDNQRENLLVMGGESNYLFRYSNDLANLKFIEAEEWYLPIMMNWDKQKIDYIMHTTDKHLSHLQRKFNLDSSDRTTIIRKERSIGIIPNPGFKILREHLEEMVLSCSLKMQEILVRTSKLDAMKLTDEKNDNKDEIKVCAFNGGSDVWVDIGDKSLGVESLQKYLCKDTRYEHTVCPILKSESLHIGDQFASLGANDFKARLSACTVWIANPRETVAILDDLIKHLST